MSGDHLVGLVAIGAALTIVGSSILARRLPAARVAKLALAWVGIFAAAFLIAQLYGRLT
jgi:hypothetical protein